MLSGRRSFCGGASIVDAALVLCASEQGEQIVLVDLLDPNVHVAPSTWTANAFRNAAVRTVHFDQYVIGADRFIGPPNWYGARPGFWFGAVGVTALWAGLADALLHYLPDLQRRSDSTSDLARATIETSMWAVSATLSYVAECIDGSRNRVPAHTNSKLDAVSARIAMRAHIDSVTKYFDQEIGPAPYATQPALAQLRNELALALSQHHGTRELSALQHRT